MLASIVPRDKGSLENQPARCTLVASQDKAVTPVKPETLPELNARNVVPELGLGLTHSL